MQQTHCNSKTVWKLCSLNLLCLFTKASLCSIVNKKGKEKNRKNENVLDECRKVKRRNMSKGLYIVVAIIYILYGPALHDFICVMHLIILSGKTF